MKINNYAGKRNIRESYNMKQGTTLNLEI